MANMFRSARDARMNGLRIHIASFLIVSCLGSTAIASQLNSNGIVSNLPPKIAAKLSAVVSCARAGVTQHKAIGEDIFEYCGANVHWIPVGFNEVEQCLKSGTLQGWDAPPSHRSKEAGAIEYLLAYNCPHRGYALSIEIQRDMDVKPEIFQMFWDRGLK
jgi:hypothetical protein